MAIPWVMCTGAAYVCRSACKCLRHSAGVAALQALLDEVGGLVLVAAEQGSSDLRLQAAKVEPQAVEIEQAAGAQEAALVVGVEAAATPTPTLLQAAPLQAGDVSCIHRTRIGITQTFMGCDLLGSVLYPWPDGHFSTRCKSAKMQPWTKLTRGRYALKVHYHVPILLNMKPIHLKTKILTLSCCRSAADGILGNHVRMIIARLHGIALIPARGRPPAALATRSSAIAAASTAE